MHITGEKDGPPVKVGVAVTGQNRNSRSQNLIFNTAPQTLQLDCIHPMQFLLHYMLDATAPAASILMQPCLTARLPRSRILGHLC